MLKIISNGNKWSESKPWLCEPDTIDKLVDVLEKYSLDPTFEDCGSFVQKNPIWLKKELTEEYRGCTHIHGNFANYSHVFNIITDESEIIEVLEQAINKNKETLKYQKFKKEYIESKQRKERARFLFDKGKITQKEMYDMMAGVI